MKPPRRPDGAQLSTAKMIACICIAALMLLLILKLSAVAGVITQDDLALMSLADPANGDSDQRRSNVFHTTRPAYAMPTPIWRKGECFNALLHSKKLVADCRQGDQSGSQVFLPYCKRILNRSQHLAEARGDESKVSRVCGQFGTGSFNPPMRLVPLDAWDPLDDHLVAKEGCLDETLFRNPINRSELARFRFTDSDHKPVGVTESKLLRVGSCSHAGFTYFTPEELVTVLHRASIGRNGRGILFTGDSMVRQLMLRIVYFIRRERYFSEHYFHQDGLYILREGGDALTVLDDRGKSATENSLQRFYPGYLQGGASIPEAEDDPSNLGRVLLAMMFQWETKPSNYRSDFKRVPDTPLHIAAFMYWWQNKDPITDLDAYMRAVEEHVGNGEAPFAASRTYKDYVFVTTPWTAPKLFGGVEPATRLSRNAKVATWIAERRAASEASSSHTRWSLLDFSAIAEVEHLPKTKDGIHYMCIWTPKYHEVVTHQKYNYNGCRDPMGLAVVQWLAHTVAFGLKQAPRGIVH